MLPQLPKYNGIMMSSLFVRREHAHTWLQEKTAENSFVVRSLAAKGESGAQFSQDDDWQPNLIGEFNHFDNGRVAAAEIRVAVGIER